MSLSHVSPILHCLLYFTIVCQNVLKVLADYVYVGNGVY